MVSYRDKKVITIGIVHELTGLSERRIRYYEERELIFLERTARGTRKYSFSDVDLIMKIADQREEGVQTQEIKQDMLNKKNQKNNTTVREDMLRGQINAHFNRRK